MIRIAQRCFLFSLLILVCYKSNANQVQFSYAPYCFNGKNLVVRQGLNTKQHFDKVEKVLQYYEIGYTRQSDTLIVFTKPLEKDWIWNATTKAEDAQWMKGEISQKNGHCLEK